MEKQGVRRQEVVVDPGVVGTHDHLGWWGEGPDSLYWLAASLFAAGARRGEKMLFVAEGARRDHRTGYSDLDRLIASGDVEFRDVDDVYGATHDFDPARQLATFEDMVHTALAGGFRGLRVVADNTPLVTGSEDQVSRWLAWEQLSDRFQSTAAVTGACFFDRRLVGEARLATLAALHPVLGGRVREPSFRLYWDEGALLLTGEVDVFSAAAFGRAVSAAPSDGTLTVDLARTTFVDHHALLTLAAVAGPDRPIRIRSARPVVRTVAAFLGLDANTLRFE